MPDRRLHNDEWTFFDEIRHAPHVEALAEKIRACAPPYVIGVHGDWGSGKTSFLRKLHLYLACEDSGYEVASTTCEELCEDLWPRQYEKSSEVETIWFDAWRYQFEANPIVALLNEIRAHFTLTRKFIRKAEKLTYAALLSIDDLTKKIGVSPQKIMEAGEQWERDRFANPLPSQLYRDLLEEAIRQLLGPGLPVEKRMSPVQREIERETSSLPATKPRRLVIFVDDLDRCIASVAFRFLEAMKIYFSISNCVFVLGMDVRHIRRAVAAGLKDAGMLTDARETSPEIYAADYLSKIFQYVFYLPTASESERKEYLKALIPDGPDKEAFIRTILESDLLPPNPRKIKYFVGGLLFYAGQVRSLLAEGKSLDIRLTLIFAYLRLMTNDVYRILEAEPDFWQLLTDWCAGTDEEARKIAGSHPALRSLKLPGNRRPDDGRSEVPVEIFDSIYPDPADESLFRAQRLINAWRKEEQGRQPTNDEFALYMLRRVA